MAAIEARFNDPTKKLTCGSELPHLPPQEHFAHEQTQWMETSQAKLADLGLMPVLNGGRFRCACST